MIGDYQKQLTAVFCKKTVLKYFAIFIGKCYVGVSFYAGLQACSSIKKRLQHRYFSVNIAKFLKTPLLTNICYRRERQRDRERQRETETERDRETERQRNRERERETERDRETERQRETVRQRDKETERQRESCLSD